MDTIRSEHADIQPALQAAKDAQQATVAIVAEPRIVAHTHRSKRTVDTEETDRRYLVQPDGTLVTESKRTTGHEVVNDDSAASEAADDATDGRPVILDEKVRETLFGLQLAGI